MAGTEGGECKKKNIFLPSDGLKQLRLERRVAKDPRINKQSPFEIDKLHRRQLRKWKSSSLPMNLKAAQPVEDITTDTTCYCASNGRSTSTKRLCKHAQFFSAAIPAINLHHLDLQKQIEV